jgi:hypothetical protein
MRERLLTVLLVPILVLPIMVIAAGGDLELLWHEVQALSGVPVLMTVYAQTGGSPAVTPTPAVRGTPTLTRWGTISAAIILALLALWVLNERFARPADDT